jgi:hypothetical protein
MADQHTPQDPLTQHPQPEQPEQTLEHPGLEGDMQLRPDYGYDTYRGSGKLEGRRAVITGGDSGIGRAVALAFAREGADVLISYLPAEEEDAQETVRVVQEAGRTAVAAPGDLQDPAYCRAIVERCVSELGGIDVLVNNAAYQMARGSIDEITPEELERTYRTNILAMFYTSQAALKHLPPGGSIINTCSVEAFKPEAKLLDYASTKAAIVNFTKGLAQDVISQGVRVNSVAPGPVWTPLIPATMPVEEVKSFGGQSPIGRAAQPAELAPAYVFLASQEASYVNGETLGVHGGMPVGT